MILSLGGVELPPTAAFVSFLFFFLAICTHILMTQYILGAETQIVTGGLEIAVLFPDAETVGSQGSAHISI